MWAGSSVGIATEVRAGRSGERIPVGTRFSARVDRPWGPPSLLYNGYRVSPGGKERSGCDADPSPLSSAAVWAVRPVQSLSACARVHLIFYLMAI